jgi:transcriptional regulator with XRE-family HTH domain
MGMVTLDVVDERRRELAAFLRSRRDRLSPQVLGLPDGGRRRTPGLRREEVAQHAGVGLTWYTWLEQGRAINASAEVLSAIARTLRLDRFERAHLFTLAGVPDPDLPVEDEVVPRSVLAMLQQLHPMPAHVVTSRYDLLAWNQAYAALMGDLESIPRERRNALWLLFTEPSWRELVVDWHSSSRHVLARFRANMAAHVGEPAWTGLVAELSEVSEEFRELWSHHEVTSPDDKRKRYLHPAVGLLELEATSLWIGDQPGMRLHVAVPVDEASHAKLETLASEPAWRPWCDSVAAAATAS